MQKTNKLCHHAPDSSSTPPSHDHGVSDLGVVFLEDCIGSADRGAQCRF